MNCHGCKLMLRLVLAVGRLPRRTFSQKVRRVKVANRGIDTIWRKHPSTCAICQNFRFGL